MFVNRQLKKSQRTRGVDILKKQLQILLAVILASAVSAVGIYAIESMIYHPVSNIEYIALFNENREKFEVMKDYMLTKGGEVSLDSQNYKEKVSDENVRAALKFYFKALRDKYDYCRVAKKEESEAIYFEYKPDFNTFKHIIYQEDPEGVQDYLELDKNWYYEDNYRETMEYTWGETKKEASQKEREAIAFYISAFVFFGIFYPVLGKIPPFRKKEGE